MLVRAHGTGKWHTNGCRHIIAYTRRGTSCDARGLYSALGVSPDATQSELKLAARERMLETHPDSGGDPEEFMRVKDAWDELSDPVRRARYDEERPEEGRSTSAFTVRVVVTPSTTADNLADKGFSARQACGILSGAHDPPAWYKEPSDVLDDDDVERVEEWRSMLEEAFWELRVFRDVKPGISGRVASGCYNRQDGIAVLGRGTEPDMLHARAFAMLESTEGEST